MFGKKEEEVRANHKGLYVVYDNLAKESGPIFDSSTDQSAVRTVVKMFLDDFKGRLDHSDFDLYAVGDLYPSTREIKPVNRLVDIHIPINNKIQEKLLLEKDQGRLMFEEAQK